MLSLVRRHIEQLADKVHPLNLNNKGQLGYPLRWVISSGLLIGQQIVGRLETELLSMAYAFEQGTKVRKVTKL